MMNIEPLTFEQANPAMTGMQMGQKLYEQMVQNQYLAPLMQQALKQSQAATQIKQAEAGVAPQMQQALLTEQQAKAPYYKGLTSQAYAQASEAIARGKEALSGAGLNYANTNLITQQTPYLVRQQQLAAFKDPMLMRQAELQSAATGGDISPNILQEVFGYGPQTAATSPQQPSQPSAMQGNIANMIPKNIPLGGAMGNWNNLGSVGAPGNIFNQNLPNLLNAQQSQQPLQQGQAQTQPQQQTGGIDPRLAAYSLFGTPNPQAAIAYNAMKVGANKTAEAQATEMQKMLTEYPKQAMAATSAINDINNFENAYNKANLKGPLVPESIAKLDPHAQAAMQYAAQLMIGELRPLFGGLGQVRSGELRMLASGSPGVSLSPEAIKDLLPRMKIALQMAQTRNDVAQRMGGMTNNPAQLNSVLASAMQHSNPIDEQGNIHPERLNEWVDYADPKYLQAVQAGQKVLPDSVLKRQADEATQASAGLSQAESAAAIRAAKKYNIPIADAIKMYKTHYNIK